MLHEHHRDGFTVSTDPARLDVDAIHAFLTTSYWAEGIPSFSPRNHPDPKTYHARNEGIGESGSL